MPMTRIVLLALALALVPGPASLVEIRCRSSFASVAVSARSAAGST